RKNFRSFPDIQAFNFCLEFMDMIPNSKNQFSENFESIVKSLSNPGYHLTQEHNQAVFTIGIESLVRIGRLQDALKLHRSMIDRGFPLDRRSVHKITKGFLFESNINEAEIWFRKISKYFGNPSPYEYNTMLSGYSDHLKYDKMAALQDEMLKNKTPPSNAYFNILIKNCLQKNDVDSAMTYINKMKLAGLQVKADTYNTIISWTLTDEKRGVFSAIKLYEDMAIQDPPIKPNSLTYLILISGCLKRGLNLHAAKYRENWLNSPLIKKDKKVWIQALKTHIHSGNISGALEIFSEMIKRTIKLDISTINLLLEGIIRDDETFDTSRLLQLFKTLPLFNLTPDTRTIKLMIAGLTLKPHTNPSPNDPTPEINFDEALVLYRTYCTTKTPHIIFQRLIRASSQLGRMDDMMALYNDMLKANVKHPISLYEDIIQGLVQTDRLDEALAWYTKLVRHNTGSTRRHWSYYRVATQTHYFTRDTPMRLYIYNLLIQHAVRAARVRVALRLYSDLAALDGHKPNTFTFNFLLIALLPLIQASARPPLVSKKRNPGVQIGMKSQRSIEMHILAVSNEFGETEARAAVWRLLRDFRELQVVPDLWSVPLLMYYYSAVLKDFEAAWKVWKFYISTFLISFGELDQKRAAASKVCGGHQGDDNSVEHKYTLEKFLHIKILKTMLHACAFFDKPNFARIALEQLRPYGITVDTTRLTSGYMRRLRKWQRKQDAAALKALLTEFDEGWNIIEPVETGVVERFGASVPWWVVSAAALPNKKGISDDWEKVFSDIWKGPKEKTVLR
ncbi:hypothetical protein HK096_006190, partial [Nowakowskiella sp. JEL0078]